VIRRTISKTPERAARRQALKRSLERQARVKLVLSGEAERAGMPELAARLMTEAAELMHKWSKV